MYAWLGDLPGMEGVVVLILKMLLTWSTFVAVLAYVVHDLYLSVRRIWGTS